MIMQIRTWVVCAYVEGSGDETNLRTKSSPWEDNAVDAVYFGTLFCRYVVIWKKVDGNWCLYIDIFNSNKSS